MELNEVQLRQELRWLRRDEGRTLTKLLRCQAVRAALHDPPDRALVERLDEVVAGLGFDIRALALKNAYAIGVKNPVNLKTRRENFGALAEVSRGPETINNWENEKIDELVAQLSANVSQQHGDHLLVAVAIESGRIVVVGEGEAGAGNPMRQLFNPNPKPFIPAFIYRLPPHSPARRLTISAFFLDSTPSEVYAEASGDLLAFVCGDGSQQLAVHQGGIPGLDAASHSSVHWDLPAPEVIYGVHWLRA